MHACERSTSFNVHFDYNYDLIIRGKLASSIYTLRRQLLTPKQLSHDSYKTL